jgi:hypothetical protein
MDIENTNGQEDTGNDLRSLLTSEVEKTEVAATAEAQQPHSPATPTTEAPAGSIDPAAQLPEDKSKDSSKTAQPVKDSTLTPEQKVEEEAQKARVDRPPQSWKGGAKQIWNAIPLEARQEIQRRESDMQMVLRENSQAKDFIGGLEQVISPHMGWMQAEGIMPMQAIQNMFQMETVARSGTPAQKVALAAEYLLTYGVDLNMLDDALAARLSGKAPAQQQAPDFAALVQREVDARLQPIFANQQQQEVAVLNNEISTFATQPGHEFFEDLRDDMANLLDLASQKGVPMDLAKAYETAKAMRPDLMQQQQLQSKQQTSQHLRQVSSSISGSTSNPSNGNAQVDPTNLRSLLENSMGD